MYKAFYGFNREPFSIVPNPKFLFMSETHREALAQLIYGVQSGKGFIVLTGEVGVGKTTILHAFLESLRKINAETAYIFNPRLNLKEFMLLVAEEFELPKPKNKTEFILNLQKFLLRNYKDKKVVVLIIDEAQQLNPQLLEEIRLLLNLETGQKKLLQVVLAGQPELWDTLALLEFRQLRQRISLYHSISPLNFEDTERYIKQRLKKSGGSLNLFTPKAIKRVFEITQGIPRLINVICNNALILGYALEKKKIDKSIIEQSAKDLKLLDSKKPPFYQKSLFYLTLFLILEIGIGAWVYKSQLKEIPSLLFKFFNFF